MTEGQRASRKFIDAHFHVWDTQNHGLTGHPPYLSKSFPVYLAQDYLNDINTIQFKDNSPEFVGGVFVEALSDTPALEAKWVIENFSSHRNLLKGVVAYADFSDSTESIEKLFAEYAQINSKNNNVIKGIRQILNFHSNKSLTWPKVKEANYFENPTWKKNFALLEKYSMSFDLQCNPEQLEDAAKFFKQFPNIPVVINHMGCITLSDDVNKYLSEAEEGEKREVAKAKYIQIWENGMTKMAELPHVYVKMSMYPFIHPQWHDKSHNVYGDVEKLVKKTFELFGSKRCMFSSNYPTDKEPPKGTPVSVIYQQFERWSLEFLKTQEEREDLFYKAAAKFYRIQ